MRETLYNKLKKYSQSDIYPFCMPGHKRNFTMPGIQDFYQADITEVPGFDNLHDPSGIIMDVEDFLKDIYGLPNVLMSVNGSTAGILAAISAAPEGSICVARNCHKSVFDGVSLARRKTYYTYPDELIKNSMIYGGADPFKIEELLNRHPDIKAVVITSPTYEGFLSDIEFIAESVHRHNALLIVDEAHGAHFPYHDSFPVSAAYLGADIVVQSLHKTLPSLNQTALVFVADDPYLARRVRRMLSAFTTTSPSYGLLASIEYCVKWCLENEEAFDEYVKMLNEFREKFSGLNSVKLIGNEVKGKHNIFDVDPSKLLFKSLNMPGTDLSAYLLKEHHIQMEAAGLSHVLALSGVMDTYEGFSRLLRAFSDAGSASSYADEKEFDKKQMERIALAFVAKTGKVFDDFIYLYPPGCPIVAPGEVFTKEIRDRVVSYIEQGLEVIEWERFTY